MQPLRLLAPTKDRGRPRERAIERLVAHAATGDEHAWAGLVEQFEALVWSVARSYRLCDEDAADVTQTVWLRLVEHLSRLRDPSRVGVWLLTTARRECQLRYRSQHSKPVVVDELPEVVDVDAPADDEGLLTQERDELLWSAVARLRDRDQALVRMLVSDPAPSYGEIAQTLDMPIGSIGPTRARVLERLRGEVARDELLPRAA
jgi:RNA polymerase sigma factor (sigma-70 family)